MLFAVAVGAQTRTVTNADIEKFRQERLRAEEDYRRNYARRGMPSPAEIERINAEKRRELDELAARLRARREAEEAELTVRANVVLITVDPRIVYVAPYRGPVFPAPVTIWGFAPYGGGRPPRSSEARFPLLPPNLQTVTDYSRMYPSSRDIYNRAIGGEQWPTVRRQ